MVKAETKAYGRLLQAIRQAQELALLAPNESEPLDMVLGLVRELDAVKTALDHTCQIGWIDSSGNATYDNHPAVAFAECRSPSALLSAKKEEDIQRFPICAAHLSQALEQGMPGWFFHPRPGYYFPLREGAQISEELSQKLEYHVKFEHRNRIPLFIAQKIRSAFPQNVEKILSEMRYGLDHWHFNLYGMYVGVEDDGYIHT